MPWQQVARRPKATTEWAGICRPIRSWGTAGIVDDEIQVCAEMEIEQTMARAGRGGGRWSVREFQLPLGKGRSDLKVVLEPVEGPGLPDDVPRCRS